MPWNTIADTDVLNEFTPQEKAALNGIQGGTANLATVLAAVVLQLRGSIAAGGYTLDPASAVSIPDQLRGDVIALARWRWLVSLPQLKNLQTDARKTAAADAEKKFNEVANQKLNIESPVAAAVPAARGGSRRRVPGRMHGEWQ